MSRLMFGSLEVTSCRNCGEEIYKFQIGPSRYRWWHHVAAPAVSNPWHSECWSGDRKAEPIEANQ